MRALFIVVTFLGSFEFSVPWNGHPGNKVWTDDYSNVFAALRVLEKKN